MKGIIYKITCVNNGKVYIGQTSRTLDERRNSHIKDCNRKDRQYNIILYNAFRKYGFDDFVWDVIHYCDEKFLDEREIYYIKKYNSMKPYGYNMTAGGGGGLRGYKHTPETIKKMRDSHADAKGSKHPFYGKKHTHETIKKMSDVKKGIVFSDETRKRMSESAKNKIFTDKHKHRMSRSSEKRYIIITPDGDCFNIKGLKRFCDNYKDVKLNPCNLTQVANGQRKHHKKYRCIKIKEN
jgi:group I intron endonuclease